MSDPKRWRDDPEAGELSELLRVARPTRSMPPHAMRRHARKVAILAAAPAAGVAVASKSWAMVAAAVVGSSVALVVGDPLLDVVMSDRAIAPQAPPSAPTTGASQDPIVPSPTHVDRDGADHIELEAVDPATEPSPSPAAPSAAASSGTLSEELALMERARGLLSPSPTQALDVLAEHQASFPHGKLATERDVLRLDALIRAGEHERARAFGTALRQRLDGSLYEERVDQLLGSIP